MTFVPKKQIQEDLLNFFKRHPNENDPPPPVNFKPIYLVHIFAKDDIFACIVYYLLH